ncbi:hypothetical protein MJO29_001722 [Puccinia striiformis f. sp. tritici]|uniref:Prokaryotic-type class I peptide chain release factors domain-containing protein n=1 Tax=Puccinia striiformis f. sp. tritici PST-78 TaxID=1165861 RepID=A0A0L0W4V7_9BASI|nr:hypothetical protein Pst134EA_003075 [Puccinia striiformis f. sp. tritici]KNE89007.1 hypothetical protein PSTG_17539 [Puccinia striiformis f. sp. tritici PST-78]KAH9464617.1 hypothetical protein Pst134EB_004141 [Puccinia striiformis f. sp. tritici]KAH9472463.1 hypothetical protein Pst134EA_003075 [Puccinia striiformis f. sp. tritici]KAI7965974.1 hypothetical protein MJO29_001722 [Puccinia striiformis f. sp. tritici]KNF06497.1 hypothetical protein PSTG_00373 [Puccinia striiformis f. sp. trit
MNVSKLINININSLKQFNSLRTFTQSAIQLKKKKHVPAIAPLDESELIEQFVRGSGPGGQAVNKTNNAVSLIHTPTGIRVQAHTHRSREANRNQARRVLAERVDYRVNRGHSKLEKMWEKERKKKLVKARKYKKKEAERLVILKQQIQAYSQSSALSTNTESLITEPITIVPPQPIKPASKFPTMSRNSKPFKPKIKTVKSITHPDSTKPTPTNVNKLR